MSEKIYKNHQICVGTPLEIKLTSDLHKVRKNQLFNEHVMETIEIHNGAAPGFYANAEDHGRYKNAANLGRYTNADNPGHYTNADNLGHYAKATSSGFYTNTANPGVYNDSAEEAGMMIAEARAEAERIIQAAEEEAHEKSIQIMEEARNAGYQEGLENAEMQYDELLREAAAVREDAIVFYENTIRNMEAEIIELVLSIAKKVIADEINIDKEKILYLIRDAISRSSEKDNLVLKVSPEDYDFVLSSREKLMEMVDNLGEFEIKKDFAMKSGGCIVESQYGCIDAGIRTKMKALEEAFNSLSEIL